MGPHVSPPSTSRPASALRWSTALVALAACGWGVSGGISGMLTSQGWDPLVMSFYRGVIGLLFALIWLALRPQDSGFGNRRLWWWSIIAGVGVAGNFALYFVSIAEGNVAVAATLMYCAPVFVYTASFILGIERSTWGTWLAIAVVMLGVALLTGILQIGAGDVTGITMGAGLLAGLSYALFIFAFKYASAHGSPQAILTIAFAVLVSTLVWLGDREQMLTALTTASWPLFALLGIFGGGISFILYLIGLRHTTPALASMVAMVEPITASLFALVVLNEHLGALQICGMLLILITVAALSGHPRKSKS